MAQYTVTRVRREWATDRSHKHIEGVCTDSNVHYSRQSVVNSIGAGNTWITRAGGYTASITVVRSCPRPGCRAAPYIRTNPDSSELDNLENLPDC